MGVGVTLRPGARPPLGVAPVLEYQALLWREGGPAPFAPTPTVGAFLAAPWAPGHPLGLNVGPRLGIAPIVWPGDEYTHYVLLGIEAEAGLQLRPGRDRAWFVGVRERGLWATLGQRVWIGEDAPFEADLTFAIPLVPVAVD